MGALGALGAQGLVLLLLLNAVRAQNNVCSVVSKEDSVTENDETILTKPVATVKLPTGQILRVASTSEDYFSIKNTDVFLVKSPDYEETPVLFGNLECVDAVTNSVVTKLSVFLVVSDINDNVPEYTYTTKSTNVTEDTKVGTIIIPASDLEAKDKDQNDVLFYELQAETPEAGKYFSLVSQTQPSLRLSQMLDYAKLSHMTFKLLVRDTEKETEKPSHTATATLVLEVLPADLRPPWFLPCAHNDSHTCVQAQYKGTIPMSAHPPQIVKFSPGPIYAVDGDWALSEKITYSLQGDGVTDGLFTMDAQTGNLTMQKSVSRPDNFTLVVTAKQQSGARYSKTQAIVVVTSEQSYASFPLNQYRGFLVLGQGAGVAVKDAADPSQPLLLRARDTIPEYNEDFMYQITNNKNFQMDGEAVLSTASLVNPGNYSVQVEARNNVTNSTATTNVEIRVSMEPTPVTPTSTSTPGPESVGSSQSSSTVQMAVLGGVLGALLLLSLVALAVLVYKHYGHRFKCCCSQKALKSQLHNYTNDAFSDDGKSNWTKAPSPVLRPARAKDPPATPEPAPQKPSTLEPKDPAPPKPAPPTPPSSVPPSPPSHRAADSPSPVVSPALPDEGSPPAVRSILTKERRPEGGYKAVWFGEDIGAEADVVVLNAPSMGAAAEGDSDGESVSNGVGDSGSEDGVSRNSIFV